MVGFKNVSNERGSSSWDLVLKILSIMLVALFAFSSGVWFGKKLSDSDYQRQALEGEFDKEVRKTASVDSHDSHGDAADEKEALTDEEVAVAAEKALEAQKPKAEEKDEHEGHGDAHAAKADAHDDHGKADAHGAKAAAPKADSHAAAKPATLPAKKEAAAHGEDAHGAPAHGAAAHDAAPAKHEAAKSEKPDLSAAHQAAVRVANNAAPVAKEQPAHESRVPSSLPKTVGSSSDVEFTVQVASYPTVDAAKEHVDALVKKGFPAFPIEAKINGKVWYRVSVGSFKSFNDASKFRAQLLKQADLPSAIVQKVSRQ